MRGKDEDILGGNQGTLLGNPRKGFSKENSTTKRVLRGRSQGLKDEGGRRGEMQEACCGGNYHSSYNQMQEVVHSLSTSQKRHGDGKTLVGRALPQAGGKSTQLKPARVISSFKPDTECGLWSLTLAPVSMLYHLPGG